MNTPALAPVLPTPSPSPAGPGPSAARDSEPGAFARELQSVTAGTAADQAREATADDDAPTEPLGTEPGLNAKMERPAQAVARKTLEHWLAMSRPGGPHRSATDVKDQAEAAAVGELASDLPRANDDEAIASEPDSLPADLTVRRPDDQPAPETAAWLSALPPHPSDGVATGASDAQGGEALPEEAGAVLADDARPAPSVAQMTTTSARQTTTRGDDPIAIGPLSFRQAHDAADRRGPITSVGLHEDMAGSAPAGTAADSKAASPLPAFAAELARAGQAVADAGGGTPGAAGVRPMAGTASGTPGPAGITSSTTADVNLPTPVHGADFMPRLSGELAVLARDGVQEARVHVNPAELGPIAVQITLDGAAAQVRLAVEHAQTRDLLEQGMPTLAAALRENGLTLTGGGVFQQARDPGRDAQAGQDASSRGGSGGGRDDGRDGGHDALAAAAPVRRVRHPGQVDVYA